MCMHCSYYCIRKTFSYYAKNPRKVCLCFVLFLGFFKLLPVVRLWLDQLLSIGFLPSAVKPRDLKYYPFVIGDGAGVGKGRTVAGTFLSK